MVLLLLFLIPAWGVFLDRPTLSAKFGGSILFHVNISKNTDITSIFWNHNKKMLAIDKPEQFKVINSRFLNRVASQQPSFSLRLSNLTEDDNGIYEAEIYTNGPTIHRTFKLQVSECHTCGVQSTKCNILLVIILGILGVFFNR
ncbi:T-lymphocyte surface antigen Ly-9-like isoform 2-T6 [Anomaloglossus baeobatrachus]|uniref:T-lymphocyte surface antigen Ly-9-like isoform X2 n=1 Tax=Anomaloglossus baeobatrachus TaxID=238106 RepID=UPI003F4FBC07